MNLLDYSKLEAGREIDDLVDQLIMTHDYHSGTKAPLYSAYQPAAWSVTRRMKDLGFSFKFFENGYGALVSFICSRGPCAEHGTKTYNHHGSYDVEAPTAELAICRAALIAVMSGEKRP